MRLRAVREARSSRPFQLAARAGFATNGVLHGFGKVLIPSGVTIIP